MRVFSHIETIFQCVTPTVKDSLHVTLKFDLSVDKALNIFTRNDTRKAIIRSECV